MSHDVVVMRYLPLSLLFMLVASVLAPAIWKSWIFVEAANPNFYYFATVLYNVALLVFVSDLLSSHLRLEMVFLGRDDWRDGVCDTELKIPFAFDSEEQDQVQDKASDNGTSLGREDKKEQ